MVECTGLENRRPFTGFVSSNLTLSANRESTKSPGGEFGSRRLRRHSAEARDSAKPFRRRRTKREGDMPSIHGTEALGDGARRIARCQDAPSQSHPLRQS